MFIIQRAEDTTDCRFADFASDTIRNGRDGCRDLMEGLELFDSVNNM